MYASSRNLQNVINIYCITSVISNHFVLSYSSIEKIYLAYNFWFAYVMSYWYIYTSLQVIFWPIETITRKCTQCLGGINLERVVTPLGGGQTCLRLVTVITKYSAWSHFRGKLGGRGVWRGWNISQAKQVGWSRWMTKSAINLGPFQEFYASIGPTYCKSNNVPATPMHFCCSTLMINALYLKGIFLLS